MTNWRFLIILSAIICAVVLQGQQGGRASPPLPQLPQTFDTAVQRIRISAVATGLANPWSLAFLPNGDMLVTERAGRLRIIRNGVLDPQPISGVPQVRVTALGGLLEVALHPRFAENGLVYLTYAKGRESNVSTTALARGRLKGTALEEVRDIFVANTWSSSATNFGGRIAFDRAGFLYLTIGERQEQDRAQKGDVHARHRSARLFEKRTP